MCIVGIYTDICSTVIKWILYGDYIAPLIDPFWSDTSHTDLKVTLSDCSVCLFVCHGEDSPDSVCLCAELQLTGAWQSRGLCPPVPGAHFYLCREPPRPLVISSICFCRPGRSGPWVRVGGSKWTAGKECTQLRRSRGAAASRSATFASWLFQSRCLRGSGQGLFGVSSV